MTDSTPAPAAPPPSTSDLPPGFVVTPDPATAWAPPQSIHQQAETLRKQLIENGDFRKRHFSGDTAARRQLAALDSIRISPENADPAALKALAEQGGIVEPPRPAAAPPTISDLSAHAPTPESYAPHWGNIRNELPPEEFNATVKTWTGWAAAMKFSPTFGKAVLEHLIDLGGRLVAMSPEQRDMWAIEQQSRGMLADGAEAYDAMKADAHKALSMAGNDPVSKFLREGAMLDAWTLRALANYHRSHQRAAGRG
jgi:hypothetical protein